MCAFMRVYVIPAYITRTHVTQTYAPVSLSHSALRSRWAPQLGLHRSPTIPPPPPAPGAPARVTYEFVVAVCPSGAVGAAAGALWLVQEFAR